MSDRSKHPLVSSEITNSDGKRMFNDSNELAAWNDQDWKVQAQRTMTAMSRNSHHLGPMTEAEYAKYEAQEKEIAQFKRDMVTRRNQSLNSVILNNTGEAAHKLGQQMANQIYDTAIRTGFLPNILDVQTLGDGERPYLEMINRNVVGAIVYGPEHVKLQMIRTNEMFPQEFTLSAKIFIPLLDMVRTKRDVLGEKYNEAHEIFSVNKDRLLIAGLKAVANRHERVSLVEGDMPMPDHFDEGVGYLQDENVTCKTILMSSAVTRKMIFANNNASGFMNTFDPFTRFEMMRSGQLGVYMGQTLMTDFHKVDRVKVIEGGDMYFLGPTEFIGQYTTREGILAVPSNTAENDIAGAGWIFNELFSCTIAQYHGIARINFLGMNS